VTEHLETMTSNGQQDSPFLLNPAEREKMWDALVETIENYISSVRDLPLSAGPPPETVRSLVAGVDFSHPMSAEDVVRFAADALSRTQVHTPHPRYFGLFNPTPTTIGIAADAIVAAFNPQLAVWKHNPFGTEVERHVIRAFGSRFGYDPATTDGVMASGGSEANHTALLVALTHAFPELERGGLRELRAQPVFYVSAESHHSFHKAARLCGLGSSAVREIQVNRDLQMEPAELESAIRKDRGSGFAPFLVVGTAGTTNAGAIDPLATIADIAATEDLWFHADAAWGGAAALVPELRPLLAGIERADSITLDAHKWLSVPMGAGILLTRHPQILGRTFHISAAYVPPKADGTGFDAYEHSLHWSRRFIGLKIFMSLAVAGWEGYAATLRQMTQVGRQLRRELEAFDWDVMNSTDLPICCFQDRRSPDGRSADYLEAIAHEVVSSGDAWISTTRVRGNIPVLRACITSYRTNADDLRIMISALNASRVKLQSGKTARTTTPEA
jgi:glutamate/tyrosine decarboxylase-like PLP-dependent enzyme